MKKILFSLLLMLVSFLIIPTVIAKKVPVYIFSKQGCQGCELAFQYFESLKNQNEDLFEEYIIEVFDSNSHINDEGLYDLLIASLKRKNGNTERLSTPTIFINDYMTIGFPQDESIIYDAILDAANKESVDIVKEEASKLKINLEKYNTKKDTKVNGKHDTLIIVSVFVVLIGGFLGLVFMSKK